MSDNENRTDLTNEFNIEHQPDNNRFILAKDGHECVLDYKVSPSTRSEINSAASVIDFTSTYVPFGLRGQGLAEKLVEQGLSWAKEQGYQIEASCWYVEKFL